jgi:cell division protease FtsH
MDENKKQAPPPPAERDPGRTDDKGASGGGVRKSQLALLVWLMVFALLATVFIWNRTRQTFDEWNQLRFEKELADGNVLEVRTMPIAENVRLIEGRFRSTENADEVRSFTVKVEFTDAVDALLREKNVARSVEIRNPWVQNLVFTLLPILLLVGLIYFLFSRQLKMAGRGAMQFGKSRARMIMPDENHKVTFADVAGAEEAKEETVEIIEYLSDPLKFKMLGGQIPKGALLTGPPGTGKTLLAKAIAGEAQVPFFCISGSDFVEMFVGVGASRVRDMFEQARRHTPCLIFIDEIDAVGRSRFSGIGGGHDEREQTLNALLVEMDGMETSEGVIILAATNRPDVLDPALLRPGRFDRQIVLDLPDIKGRRAILDVHIKKIKMAPGVDLDRVARSTPGLSGADLANLVNEAALLAARRNLTAADMAEFEEARDKVRWGRERRSRKISDDDRRITAYHESGHTLVALYTPKAMPVHKVTIIPRGIAYLGATMSLPLEDRYTQTRSEFEAELAVLMGGRSAEQLTFDDITSGAAGDIQHATRIARGMVCAFGMSDQLGTVQYGGRDEHIYLGRDIVRSDGYSEATSREIDLEIKRIITVARAKADAILNTHRDQLELLTRTLLEKETLDAVAIKALLGLDDTANLNIDGVGLSRNIGPEIPPPAATA